MANRKISDLTALTAPVAGDLLPIVDISEAAAADKNKKITYGTFLSSVPLGIAAAPSVAFTGDTNTGIYSPGADQLAISTGGTSRLAVSTTAVSSTLAVDHLLGAAATPSITFTGDLNTGIYSPGADQLAISTNGTEKLIVKSDGKVGIGTSSPASLFHLNASASGGGAIFSSQGYNCATVSQVISSADAIFGGGVIASDVAQEVKKINADPAHYVKIQTGEGISFHTNITGVLGTSVNRTTNERLRITSAGVIQVADAGNITVGTTTGTKIGTATTQKLGFYNATPVVQPTAVANATTAVDVITQLNNLLAKLRTLGIIAT